MATTVVCLGHGGGVPTAGTGNTNFAIVEHSPIKGTTSAKSLLQNCPFWLVDCGPETVAQLAEWDAFKNLQVVILTHCHSDHSGGICSLAWRMLFVEHMKKIPLVLPIDLAPLLKKQTVELEYPGPGMMKMYPGMVWDIWSYFTGYNLTENTDLTVGSESVTHTFHVFGVSHGIPNLPSYMVSVRAEHPSSELPSGFAKDSRTYRNIVFSGDTVDPLGREVIENATIVFHDVQTYNDGDGTEVHCPYKKLRDAVPRSLRNKVAVCHSGWFLDSHLDGFERAMKGDIFPL